MFKRLPTRLSLIAVLLGLTACATVPQGSTSITNPVIVGSNTNGVSLGAMIAVPPNAGVEGDQARVVDEYFSASGRQCVRVELAKAGSSTRVICQREGGDWSFTRSLFNDQVPEVSNEPLITTPLKPIDSTAVELPDPGQSGVVETLGSAFDIYYKPLSSYDTGGAGNYSGTWTAGPAIWAKVALADSSDLYEFVGPAMGDELNTGTR